jgi:hypothetical protein
MYTEEQRILTESIAIIIEPDDRHQSLFQALVSICHITLIQPHFSQSERG